MNKLDSGGVVLFCGAGISQGKGSELPNYEGLVDHVYEENNMELDAVERAARGLDECGRRRGQPSFDKVLGLLERKERLGAAAMRRTVIKRLSRPPTDELNVHEALITLSRTEQGVRLITTNFDNRFVETGKKIEVVDAAPKLPLPKPHNWASLVHLHGRIVPDDDGSHLVLTAADFGRAYLTERWAARFVTELFRGFTVVFAGYSVGDPVMAYMVDALAAERAKGGRFEQAYAFADYDGEHLTEQGAKDAWLAKNVTPILYDEIDNHRLLGETLIEWARIRRDPYQARSQIAVKEMSKLPLDVNDPVVERVSWALQDPVAAKALANAPPVTKENDYVKVGKWLEMFAEKGLLCCSGADVYSGSNQQSSAVVQLVTSGIQSHTPSTLDTTRAHLAQWLANHLHVPQVFEWVLRNGGHMHPALRRDVRVRLADTDSNIPPRLRILWTTQCSYEPTDPWRLLWMPKQYQVATSESERRLIEDAAIKSLSPHLIVEPGPASRLAFREYSENKQGPLRVIDTCGHLKLVAGDADSWTLIADILKGSPSLSRYAGTLTSYLEQALILAEDDDETYLSSSLYRPSIAPHSQNDNDLDWTQLIDWTRDSYFALAEVDRVRAESLLRSWVVSKQPLFRRLALHALTENSESDIRLARKLILAGRRPGLWEPGLRREVLRFLRLAGSRLPSELRVEIISAVHAGSESAKGSMLADDARQVIRHEKALLLRKLAESGARLDEESKALADEVAPDVDERDEFAVWQGEGRILGDHEIVPRAFLSGSVADVVAVIKKFRVSRHCFRAFGMLRPAKAAAVLRQFAMSGQWPTTLWRGFFDALTGLRQSSMPEAGLQANVAQLVTTVPNEVLADIGSSFARFVKDLAEEYEPDREQEIGVLWTKAWNGIGNAKAEFSDRNDVLTDALNHSAGILAEAALLRLWKYEPEAGKEFPPPIQCYFESIVTDPAGSLGRVMLATRLCQLFVINPEWTREHLISRLSSKRSDEAADLWSAYSWSPTVSPDLLQAFKEPFLAMLCREDDSHRRTRSLSGLFVMICLELPNELTRDEIRGVFRSMSEEALTTVLVRLKSLLKGDSAEQARIWHKKVHPWLEKYWPTSAARNTSATSVAMLDMLAEVGDAFPEAVDWSLLFLQATGGKGLYQLHKNGQAGRYPKWILKILDVTVGSEGLSVRHRHTLYKVLDLLRQSQGMTDDVRFQRLYKIANA